MFFFIISIAKQNHYCIKFSSIKFFFFCLCYKKITIIYYFFSIQSLVYKIIFVNLVSNTGQIISFYVVMDDYSLALTIRIAQIQVDRRSDNISAIFTSATERQTLIQCLRRYFTESHKQGCEKIDEIKIDIQFNSSISQQSILIKNCNRLFVKTVTFYNYDLLNST